MLEEWKLIKSEQLFESAPFNLLQKDYINPNSKREFNAFVLDIRDWSNVIARNEVGNILLIRQYRFGTDKVELEIPGGYIELNESPRDAAIRELKEETGYNVKEIKQIGVVAANPAIMNNKCFTFLAEISDQGEVNFDPDEIIETEFYPPKQVKDFIINGEFRNAYCVGAFLWYLLSGNTF